MKSILKVFEKDVSQINKNLENHVTETADKIGRLEFGQGKLEAKIDKLLEIKT